MKTTRKTARKTARKSSSRKQTASQKLTAFVTRMIAEFGDDDDAAEMIQTIGILQADSPPYVKKSARMIDRAARRQTDDFDLLEDLADEAEDWTESPQVETLPGVYIKPASGDYPAMLAIRKTLRGAVGEGKETWCGPAICQTLLDTIADGSLQNTLDAVVKANAD